MESKLGACVTVAKGSVGESGASALLHHKANGPNHKMIVLRKSGSSLCPNTGAAAILVVNGVPTAFGDISTKGSIQTEAAPGANVVAIVHTVPLFNGVVCVRLGDLHVTLDECELELAASTERHSNVIQSCPPTRDWYAWNDTMPPKPDVFHVKGEVQVSNPGVQAFLVPRVPQGINPRILLLDLVLIQLPGIWPRSSCGNR